MDFETAAILSLWTHYALFILGSTYFILRGYFASGGGIIKSIRNFYIIILIWGFSCIIFDGCPVTLLENYISLKIYGEAFYPGYSFDQSHFSTIFSRHTFYIPLIVGGILYLKKRANGSRFSSTS